MPRLDVRPFVPADYAEAVRLGDPIRVTERSPEAIGEMYAEYGPAFTGRLGGRVVACAGLMIPWQGHGDAWAILTPEGRAHGVLVHRAVVRGLRALIRVHGIRRLQADVLASFAGGCRWVEALGFHLEGLMPAYGPRGETFARYAWIHPDVGVIAEDGHLVPAISGGADAPTTRPMRPEEGLACSALYRACHPTWPAKPPTWWWSHPTLVMEVPGEGFVGATAFSLSPAPSPEVLKLMGAEHPEIAWGHGVYIAPPARGRGYGQMLADARHAAIKALGVDFFIGMTQPDNHAMITIFERQRLTRGVTVPKAYPDGTAAVMYHGGIA